MRWIIGTGKDIAVDSNQVQARGDFIRTITDAEVSPWGYLRINGQMCEKYLCCASDDGIDGTFLTAHVQDVYELCSLQKVCECKFVVANTCIWDKLAHKQLLYKLMNYNRTIELWFAKQELSIDVYRNFRQSTTIKNIGQFEFQTSLSERELFKNRKKGFMEAMRIAFIHVSPVILPNEE